MGDNEYETFNEVAKQLNNALETLVERYIETYLQFYRRSSERDMNCWRELYSTFVGWISVVTMVFVGVELNFLLRLSFFRADANIQILLCSLLRIHIHIKTRFKHWK